MIETIDLTPDELAQVKAILAMHLPDGARVGVFGSRATTGTAKRWSISTS